MSFRSSEYRLRLRSRRPLIAAIIPRMRPVLCALARTTQPCLAPPQLASSAAVQPRALWSSAQMFLRAGRIMPIRKPLGKAPIMTNKFATSCFIVGTLLMPAATFAADSHTDSAGPAAGPATYVKDSVITTKIKTKLAEEKLSSLTNTTVDTDGKGAVVLGGTVKTQAEADKAVAIAKQTAGVTSVKSDIRIKKGE
jgi:hyperosmotically inducible periplasmic protein